MATCERPPAMSKWPRSWNTSAKKTSASLPKSNNPVKVLDTKPEQEDDLLEDKCSIELEKLGFLLGKTIGKGSYSVVKLVEKVDMRTRAIHGRYACKIIDTAKASQSYATKFLPRELAISKSINHQNLVRARQVVDLGEMVFVFMDYCPQGDLLEHIQKHGPILEKDSKYMFWQILQAMKYLHGKGIAHRDIKCENVLMHQNSTVKLTDFGFARGYVNRVTGQPALSRTFCGSMAYAAPEILQGLPYYSDKYDMWSLGCMLFIMITGKMPFSDKDPNYLLQQQMNKSLFFPVMTYVPGSCKKLIRELLNPKPSERPDVNQVLNTTWLKMFNSWS